MKFAVFLALLFAGASAFVPASQPLRAASARSASKGQMEMAVPVGINGFGRIGRLVARIMCKSPECDLKLINTGASCEYMAYQMKYDSIHGRYDGTIEADGDFLIVALTTGPLLQQFQPISGFQAC
jgi:glyceraldehyde 3-phosphate dehydrogenase